MTKTVKVKEKLVPGGIVTEDDNKKDAKVPESGSTPEEILAAINKLKSQEELVEEFVTPKPEHLPRIEIVYDKQDRKQPYKVKFYNCETRSVFQKMIVFTFQKALMLFRRNLIMEGEKDDGK